MIQTRCNRLLKGDLEWLWASCTKLGRARQTRLAANPHTGRARTATQLDALAQKLARAGNFSKSCQAVCSDSTQSLGPHTLAKLWAKNPQGSVDFDKTFWPSAADMDALRQVDDWRRVAEEHFSFDNIRKYLPVLPLEARRMLTAGARANTSLFCSARKMRNFTTSTKSTWSCPSF